MAEVLLINEKGFHMGCVNQNHKDTMKGKKNFVLRCH